MGGHGGLNILPQKKWHVYNQDNRERVEADERRARERRDEEETRAASARLSLAYSVLQRENPNRDRPDQFDLRTQQDLPLEQQPQPEDPPADASRRAPVSTDVTFGDLFRRNAAHTRWYKLPQVDNSELVRQMREEADRRKKPKKEKRLTKRSRSREKKKKSKSSKKRRASSRSASRSRSREKAAPGPDRREELERLRSERLKREAKEKQRALDLLVATAAQLGS